MKYTVHDPGAHMQVAAFSDLAEAFDRAYEYLPLNVPGRYNPKGKYVTVQEWDDRVDPLRTWIIAGRMPQDPAEAPASPEADAAVPPQGQQHGPVAAPPQDGDVVYLPAMEGLSPKRLRDLQGRLSEAVPYLAVKSLIVLPHVDDARRPGS